MAKVFQVEKANPRYKGDVVEDVEIKIHKSIDFDKEEDPTDVFYHDAEELFDALRVLPGGTFDRLLMLMLRKAASSFVVPHDFREKERAGPKMFTVIERVLQEIEFSKQNGTILNLGWIEANCKSVIEEVYPKTKERAPKTDSTPSMLALLEKALPIIKSEATRREYASVGDAGEDYDDGDSYWSEMRDLANEISAEIDKAYGREPLPNDDPDDEDFDDLAKAEEKEAQDD